MKNCFDIQNYDSQVMRLGPPIRKQHDVKVDTSLRDFETVSDRPVMTCADIFKEALRILDLHFGDAILQESMTPEAWVKELKRRDDWLEKKRFKNET